METINQRRLVNYFEGCKEHQDILDTNKEYDFSQNLPMIERFLESTEFTEGLIVDNSDYKKYIAGGRFFVGIDIVNDELDDCRYLFDAFNVYYAENASDFKEYPYLTQLWRTFMIKSYPHTSYVNDLKTFLKKEKQERIDAINRDFEAQLKGL